MLKNKTKRKIRLILPCFIAILVAPLWSEAQLTNGSSVETQSKDKRSDSFEAMDSLLDKLAQEPNLGLVYIDDGSGEGTVVNNSPNPVVRQIIALGPRAIPVLIAHLDDRRPTSALYKVGNFRNEPVRTPLGFVVLDILTQITRDTGALFVNGQKHCEFDGMGACVKDRYYLKPEVFISRDSGSEQKVEKLKASWSAARRNGIVVFKKPSWISKEAKSEPLP
jgi:hypothetical protein